MSTARDAAARATWPPAKTALVGGFAVGRGLGGGMRVSAAWALPDRDLGALAAVEAQHAAWEQPAVFGVDPEDGALAAALAAQGYREDGRTLWLEAPVAALLDRPIPPVTALESWPPLAIQRDLWAALGIGPPRLAVMDRVAGPKAAILGRTEDRAAGVAFAAVHGDYGMVHALGVLARWQHRGLGGWMMRRAADFAGRNGASRMAVAVLAGNAEGRAFHAAMGLEPAGEFAVWRR